MDILTLVLFLVFVIVPVINGLLQRGRGNGGGGQGGTKGQGRPPQGKTQTTTQTTRTANTTRSAPAPTAQPRDENDSSFDRRLEEARRRVQEAMDGNRGGRTAQTSPQRDTTREEATTLFPTAPRPQTAQDARASRGLEMGGRGLEMGGQGLEGSTLNSAPMSGASLTSTAAELARRGEAAPLRVQRRRGKKSATLGRDALMALDERAVLRGLIWHQILSDPPSKHPHRRRSSQHR